MTVSKDAQAGRSKAYWIQLGSYRSIINPKKMLSKTEANADPGNVVSFLRSHVVTSRSLVMDGGIQRHAENWPLSKRNSTFKIVRNVGNFLSNLTIYSLQDSRHKKRLVKKSTEASFAAGWHIASHYKLSRPVELANYVFFRQKFHIAFIRWNEVNLCGLFCDAVILLAEEFPKLCEERIRLNRVVLKIPN